MAAISASESVADFSVISTAIPCRSVRRARPDLGVLQRVRADVDGQHDAVGQVMAAGQGLRRQAASSSAPQP